MATIRDYTQSIMKAISEAEAFYQAKGRLRDTPLMPHLLIQVDDMLDDLLAILAKEGVTTNATGSPGTAAARIIREMSEGDDGA